MVSEAENLRKQARETREEWGSEGSLTALRLEAEADAADRKARKSIYEWGIEAIQTAARLVGMPQARKLYHELFGGTSEEVDQYISGRD